MKIEIAKIDKKRYLDLLLLADEQESMIDHYLERGDLFVLLDPDVKSVCVVTDEGNGIFEVKNLATDMRYQRQGYGTAMMQHIFRHYQGRCAAMLVGTGDSPWILSFYQQCGFAISHTVPNFFVDHYDHPILDNGKQLKDMIYLRKEMTP